MSRTLRSILTLTALGGAITSARAQDRAGPTPTPPALTRADLQAWLDGLVPAALREGDIAGLVISVVRQGEVLLEAGYGLADVATRRPMDPGSTVVRAASVAKSFTAAAVMQLVEAGRLDLDRDVNDYLDFAIPPAFGAPITLRHLLTHTAGFAEIAYQRHDPPPSLREHVRQVPRRIYPPGTIPAYSNYGVALAGYIAARAAGESFTDLVERRILAPLGMDRSTFRMAIPPALAASLASTYPVASAPPYAEDLLTGLAPTEAPASALAATARDMTRFMLAHLGGGSVGEARILRPETVRLMHAPAFVPMAGAQPVALGLFRTDYRGHHVIGHSGDGEGAHAEMKLLPDEGVGVFIAMNSSGVLRGILPAAFALRARLFEAFVDRYFPTAPVPEEPTAATAREHARLIAGEYAWSRQARGDYREALELLQRAALGLVITARNDGTIETPPSISFQTAGLTQRWREVRPFVWREVGGDAHLLALVQDGRVRAVWTDQAASFWVNLPVPWWRSARLNGLLLGFAALTLLVVTLAWSIRALLRRRGGAAPGSGTPQPRAAGLTRLACALGVVYLIGWVVVIAADLPSSPSAWPSIRLLQLLGAACVAGAGVAAWNAGQVWQDRRGWAARIGAALVALALVDLAWFSLAFRLLSVRIP